MKIRLTGRVEADDVKITATVLKGEGTVRVTEYDGEGELRTATYTYYLVDNVGAALKIHARGGVV